MKKWSALLFFVTVFTTAFAQPDARREEARRVILGDRNGSASYPKSGDDRNVVLGGPTVYSGRDDRYPERYPTISTSRERRLYEINREYDAKIYSIRQNRTLSRYERERVIRQLENERRWKLEQVRDRYTQNSRYSNDDDCNDTKYKGNNGNHHGWRNGNRNPYRGN